MTKTFGRRNIEKTDCDVSVLGMGRINIALRHEGLLSDAAPIPIGPVA